MYPSSQVFLKMLVCILSCSQALRENFREHLILPELKHLFYFLQAVCVKQQSVVYCWWTHTSSSLLSHNWRLPGGPFPPPLFIVAQWNIPGVARVPEYMEKVKLSKSLIRYLGFWFYGYFAAWKQRRKPASYCQPAEDGPKPGDTQTHTLSYCLLLLWNSWQDFFKAS